MPSVKTHVFSLEHSLFSGQCFGWKKIGDWYYGEILGNPAKVRQVREELRFYGAGEESVRKYFGLDEDIEGIYRRISKGLVMRKAVRKFYGLRILGQDPWVCSLSFLCSISCNIPGIEGQLGKLKDSYGRETSFDGRKVRLFPRPEAIRNAEQSGLRKCSLGFRDRYVKALANAVSVGKFERLRKASYQEAKESLMEVFGIGPKVADCICLFSLDKSEAFPIDVWIQRAMEFYYGDEIKQMFPRSKFSYKDIQKYAWSRWGRDAGYAQQFLYVYSKTDPELRKGREKVGKQDFESGRFERYL